MDLSTHMRSNTTNTPATTRKEDIINHVTSECATNTCPIITQEKSETCEKSTNTSNPQLVNSGCNPSNSTQVDTGSDPIVWWWEETVHFLRN
jgi:hypothetical protein